MRLTATTIKSLTLPEGKDDYTHFCDDLPGFGLRLRASGGKVFIAQYARSGKTRRITLGSPDVVNVGQAREQAQRILASVKLGQDPASEKKLSRVRAGETVGGLLPRFLTQQRAKLRPKSFIETTRHLERQIAKLHPLPVSALDRRTIAAVLSEIGVLSGPAAANRARGSLSAYCLWLMKEGLIETNPTEHLNEHVENGPRDRLLSDSEVAAIWNAAGDAGQYGSIIRLLILTGARREEIGSLRWSECDFDKALITLPGTRTKNGREHLIPFSDTALSIITAQPRRTNSDGTSRDLIFGGAGQGFSDWSGSKRDLDARVAANEGAPLAPWVLHDTRRLFSTRLNETLEVPAHVVELMLGHAAHRSGVKGVYNKAEFIGERRRALQRWADHLATIVTGTAPAGAVVRLHA